MVGLGGRDNWSIQRNDEVDPGVWHKVGVELSNITLIVPSNLKEVSLETSAVVCEFSDAIQAQIYDLLAKWN